MTEATSRRRPTSGVGGVGSRDDAQARAPRERLSAGSWRRIRRSSSCELRAGVHAELLDEQLAGGPAGGERVGLSARAVERECVLGAHALPVRLGRDQPLQLGHELVGAPERELGVVEELDRPQPLLLELSRLRRRGQARRRDPPAAARSRDRAHGGDPRPHPPPAPS